MSMSLDDCKYKNIFLIQLFMGLRIGEVLALKEIMGHYDIEVTKNVYIDIQEKF